MKKSRPYSQAQTALEYMLLLAVVVAIVLGGMNLYLSRTRESSEVFFNRVLEGIYGAPPHLDAFSFELNTM